MNSKTICTAPWMHLNFEPDGKVIPCCLTSSHQYFLGDLNTDSIEEIWNSSNMKKLRLQFLNGEKPEICHKCFDEEKLTGLSTRTNYNKDFSNVLEKIPNITLEDGTCEELDLQYWDFRFSNLCNFKCRSCGPRYSSSWVPDAKKLGITDQQKVWNIESINKKTNFNFLNNQISKVKGIYFAGGEPLLMDEHWYILDKLIENNRLDVKLSYNTNCSTLTYGKKHIIDYWKQWELGKLEVWPSIDEIGKRAELLRSGTIWNKIEKNLEELTKYDNIDLRPAITVGAWNVYRLPEIISYLTDLGVIRHRTNFDIFFINLIIDPDHYSINILPDKFKKDIAEKLKSFIIEYNKKYNTNITRGLMQIFNELKKPFNLDLAKKFVSTTLELDKIRKENLFTTIPEMEEVRQEIKRWSYG